MRKVLLSSVVAWSLGMGFVAEAKELQPYRSEDEKTPEERAAERAAAREQLHSFDSPGVRQKSKPVPWTLVGLVSIAFVVLTPFAYGAFRRTAGELERGKRR